MCSKPINECFLGGQVNFLFLYIDFTSIPNRMLMEFVILLPLQFKKINVDYVYDLKQFPEICIGAKADQQNDIEMMKNLFHILFFSK